MNTELTDEQKKLQEAAELLQKHKQNRENEFQRELQLLCEKYGIKLSTQIVITAL